MWNKRKEIEGVGAATSINLKAAILDHQEKKRRLNNSHPSAANSTALRTSKLNFSETKGRKDKEEKGLRGSNRGVSEREDRDKRDYDSSHVEITSDDIRRKLEQKANLYDRIARGEVEVDDDQNNDKTYLVDFLTKSYVPENYFKEEGKRNSDSDDDEEYDDSRRRSPSPDSWNRNRRRGLDKDLLPVSSHSNFTSEELEADEKRKQEIKLINEIRDQTNTKRQQHTRIKSMKDRAINNRLAKLQQLLEQQGEDENSDENGDDNQEHHEENENEKKIK